MELELIQSKAADAKKMPATKKVAAQHALFVDLLSSFAGGNADLTLDDVFEQSRAALGMRSPDGPRSL